MTREPSISRRNFFGIVKPSPAPSRADTVKPDHCEPIVEECTASMDRVPSLLSEIQSRGSHIQIGVRWRDPRYGPSATPSVLEIERLLNNNLINAAQVRYRFGGRLWIDTFTPVAENVRIVRVQHPF